MSEWFKFWLAKSLAEFAVGISLLVLIVVAALVHYWLTRPRRKP